MNNDPVTGLPDFDDFANDSAHPDYDDTPIISVSPHFAL